MSGFLNPKTGKPYTSGRRPGESVGGYLIATGLGTLLRKRRAGSARSVLTLIPGPDTIALASTSFADGAPIPDEHAGRGRGDNRSPQLQWAGVPSAARQLLLVMEDADVPLSRPILHMVAVFPPTITGFSDGDLTIGIGAPDGVRFLPASFGRKGYEGPRALAGHGPHRYDFVLYALDQELPADTEARRVEVLAQAVNGHVLARGRLTGTQEG